MAQDTVVNSWSAKRLQPQLDYPAPMVTVKLKASTTYSAGTVLGPVTATPGLYGPYDDAAVDGRAVAELVLGRACITDASSNISYSDTATGSDQGAVDKQIAVYAGGCFKYADLVGIDAAGVTDLKARTILNGKLIFIA